MAQHAILRFEKHKGNPARPLEAHHERQKEQYASNPDIDTSRSKYNFHIIKPESRYYHFIKSRIEQAGGRTRRDSTRFVDTLITASPEFFEKKSPKEIQEFFQRAADFLIGRVGKENIVSAELDGRKQELLARIAELTVEAISPEQVSQISGYLDTWENVSFDDKRRVVDLMITTIAATSDSLNITWKIWRVEPLPSDTYPV